MAPALIRDHSTVTPACVQSLHSSFASGGVQQLDGLLNLGVHFSTYADVFEDIACLSNDHPDACDFQSDQEEII